MLTTKWLGVSFVLGLVVAVLFAFTLIGVVGEVLAVLAVVALVVKGVRRFAHRPAVRHQ